MIDGLVIPPHWLWATFGDVASVASDLVDPTLTPDAIHIAPNHIESWTGKLLPFGTVQGDGVTSPKHRFRVGHILYSKIRPYLAKAAIPSFAGVCSADMYPVETKLEPRFLLHWMLTPWFTGETARNQGRTILPKINQDALARMPVPVAPIPEQRRIVAKIEELFSDLDAGVAALKRVRANLKRYRASVLKAAVEGRLTAKWRKEHPSVEPASKLLQRILTERRKKWEEQQRAKFAEAGKTPPKNWQDKYQEPAAPDTTNLPELPKGWLWTSLDQLCSRITDGTHLPPQFIEEGVPFIFVRNIVGGKIEFGNTKFISDQTYVELNSRCPVVRNDILYSAVGSYGVAVLVDTDRPFSFQRHIAHIKPIESISARYLVTCLNSSVCLSQAHRLARGIAQKTVTLGDLTRYVIPLAPVREQSQIMSELDCRLSMADEITVTNLHTLQRAPRLRQSILKRAFEGKLVPQDPKDEPASVLLDRITNAKPTNGTGKIAARKIRIPRSEGAAR